MIFEMDAIIDNKMKEVYGINPEDFNGSLQNNVDEVSLSEDRFSDGSMDNQIKEKFEPIYKEVSDELGREANHNDLVKDFIQTFGKEETKRILPGLERASQLLGREVTDTSHFFIDAKKNTEMLGKRYSELINLFDDFYNRYPDISESEEDFYQLEWRRERSIMNFSFYEEQDFLIIEVELKQNKFALAKYGLNIEDLPNPKKNLWKYSKNMPQDLIYNDVAPKINQFFGYQF